MFDFLRKLGSIKENPVGRTVVMTPGQPVWSERQFRKLADEGYARNAVAHFCIYKISSAIACVPLRLCRMVNGQMQEIDDHELLRLLEKPNAVQSGDDLIHALVSFFLIGGNAYLLDVARKQKELWLLNPENMQVIADESMVPRAYRFKGNKGRIDFPVDLMTGESEVMHWKDFHPWNEWYGLSKMEPAAYGVDTLNSVMAWNKSFLDSACIPSGVFETKSALTDSQFARLKEQIGKSYSGAKNAGKPLLLDNEITWKPISVSPKDTKFLENYHVVARQVASLFGVPAQMLGIPGDSTYNNMAEARLIFWEDTVIPLMDKMINKLNNWLTPQFGDDLHLYYKEEDIRALEPRRAEMHKRLTEASWMTRNEKRRATGYDDLAEDFIDLPLTSVPIDANGNLVEDIRGARAESDPEEPEEAEE